MTHSIIVAALYKFTALPDYKEMHTSLQTLCKKNGIKGTLLLALEGINGTIAGSREGINQVKAFLDQDGRFKGMEYKESFADKMPFYRLKVRLKKEIVTFGVPGVSPVHQVGTYVEPRDWNELLNDPDVLVIDTRNQYEVDVGTFKGASNPETTSFTQFPDYVKTLNPDQNKKVAMFCTGGIRCEKASSYMLNQGFETVYHLKGGILKYLETVPEDQSLWQGECFVFDRRVTVSHGLALGQYDSCHGCRHPISEEDKKSPEYERGVTCPHCYHLSNEKTIKRARERQRQEDLAHARGVQHMGAER